MKEQAAGTGELGSGSWSRGVGRLQLEVARAAPWLGLAPLVCLAGARCVQWLTFSVFLVVSRALPLPFRYVLGSRCVESSSFFIIAVVIAILITIAIIIVVAIIIIITNHGEHPQQCAERRARLSPSRV